MSGVPVERTIHATIAVELFQVVSSINYALKHRGILAAAAEASLYKGVGHAVRALLHREVHGVSKATRKRWRRGHWGPSGCPFFFWADGGGLAIYHW